MSKHRTKLYMELMQPYLGQYIVWNIVFVNGYAVLDFVHVFTDTSSANMFFHMYRATHPDEYTNISNIELTWPNYVNAAFDIVTIYAP